MSVNRDGEFRDTESTEIQRVQRYREYKDTESMVIKEREMLRVESIMRGIIKRIEYRDRVQREGV